MSEATIAPALALIALAALPAIGQPIEGNGIFAGLTTKKDGTHCAVVLLDDKPEGRLTWHDAMAWAAEREAYLPSRPVAALLFANLRDQFEKAWLWTDEQHEEDGAYAWNQYFYNGIQSSGRTSYEGRVRAVRLIPLNA